MCGIAAALGTDDESGSEFVERALSLLAHRGPDDTGRYLGPRIALAHRRLSILDLSPTGHQPMSSRDGRWTLIYNGEVYNHLALRARVEDRWEFRGHGDGETVLALLALEGPTALEQMVGMWALAMWDAAERTLLVSRDRYGQKPLYWRQGSDGSLRFASEIAPLLQRDERPEVDRYTLAEFLATGNYGHLPGRTFLRDIHSFPPAHWAVTKPGETAITARRYWHLPTSRSPRPYDEAAKRAFRSALDQAVLSQRLSDVPVGATLSGGLDSSAVVGLLASSGGSSPIPVFTAQATGSTFDETRYVAAVERMWGRRLAVHRVELRDMRLSEHLVQVVRSQEEPFGDPSIVAHGLLMQAARREGVPVILGGQGGDELLFGYGWMSDTLLSSSLREGRLNWVASQSRRLHLPPSRLARITLGATVPRLEQRLRKLARERRHSWLGAALRERPAEVDLEWAPISDRDRVWQEAVERTALPHLTHYDDRSGMAHSIEGRMPFLDHRLAELLATFPPEAFVHDGASKRVLRESCADVIPSEVLRRTDKIGFYTPMLSMLRDEGDWVRSVLSDDIARDLAAWDTAALDADLEHLDRAQRNDGAVHRVWRALAVRQWAESFRVRPMHPQPIDAALTT